MFAALRSMACGNAKAAEGLPQAAERPANFDHLPSAFVPVSVIRIRSLAIGV